VAYGEERKQRMTILVGSDVPGLLSALEQTLGGSQQLAIARDAERIAATISNPAIRLDALILSDTIAPHPGKDIATSLWELIAYVSRYREPVAPVILTLAADTPAVIQDALRAEVRKTGGDIYLLSQRARSHDHPEAKQAVAWLMSRLKLEPQRRQVSIVSTSNAGGSGKTSTVMHFCLQLSRLGLRVLVVDLDIAQGALLSWFRAQGEAHAFFTTLPQEHPVPVGPYPLELVERRIFHHSSGLDVLFAGRGVRDQLDISTACLEQLIDTIALLDYDVVCYDMPGEWKVRPVIVSLLARRATTPFVVCPPGRKERDGAFAALEVLGKIEREDGRTALDAAVVCFIEGERGHVMPIRSMRQALLRQYPTVTDLGTLPRDPALLSMAAERQEFCSVFDLAPRRPYCHAIRAAVRRWIDRVELPATWLTRVDPYERRPRQPFWSRSANHARALSRRAQAPAAQRHEVQP
jgi:MinD-like ATPase involved in chromosome partitioning or flagellar assembly